jgi:cytochrome b
MSSFPPAPNSELKTVRVWDLPTRVFHWLLAIAIVALIVTAHIGGNAMDWHFRLGYLVMALLLFRLVWGFAGGYWSRFARFFYTPAVILRYAKGAGRPDELHDVGHNPLGSLSVYALLVLLSAQVGSGLFADDEIAASGPLVSYVSSATSGRLSQWHAGPGQWIIIALACLHVLAIVFYVVVKRKTLVRPMLSGDKRLEGAVPSSKDGVRNRLLALIVLAACIALTGWVFSLRV